MKRLQYSIGGMSCAACVSHVEKAVRRVLGADDQFTVSLLTNSLSVIPSRELSPKELELLEERLSHAIGSAGYRLLTAPPREEGKNKAFHQSLVRLILSCIFTLALMYVSMGSMLSLPQPPFLVGVENALPFALVQLALTVPVVVLNFKFFRSGTLALLHRAPNMDSLIAVGAGASLIYGLIAIFMIAKAGNDHATVHGWLHDLYFESAAMILTLVSLGKLLESRAKDKASDSVKALAKRSPKFATRVKCGAEERVPVEEIAVGDEVLVRAGELIPIDGEVVFGQGAVDESPLTGESMPVDKEPGHAVHAACVLTAGAVTVRATHVGEDTSLSRMIRLLEDAAASKAPIARIADRVSAVFVPCVMAISVLTFVLWMIFSHNVEQALRSSISVLVISCPCALGLATPTAITVGIGRGAKNGILFRNAESLEKLCSVKTVVFDKTGTVTEGQPALTDLFAYGTDADTLLTMAYSVEHLSAHPLSLAIRRAAEQHGLSPLPVEQFENEVGVGVVATVNGDVYRVGKPAANVRENLNLDTIASPDRVEDGTAVYLRDAADEQKILLDIAWLEQSGKTAVTVTKNGCTCGVLGISDRIRSDSKDAVEALKKAGVQCRMLTGDNARTAAYVAQQIGLDGWRAGLLPEDKERELAAYTKQAPTAMVGDGINDAPALVRADVGIAVGAGTEVAIDSADVVLSGSSLSGIAEAFALSRATIRIIKQNLFWALFYNAVCIPVAAGLFYPLFAWQLTPMIASAAMSFSSVCVVTNALRLRTVSLLPYSKASHSAACCEACEQPIQKGENQTMLFQKSTEQTYVISVGGMMCPRCVAHVKSALEAVKGVSAVEVSLEANTATVTATAPLSKLTAAIIAAGYEVKD